MLLSSPLRLDQFAPLSHEDRRALSAAVLWIRELGQGDNLVKQGERSAYCHLVLEGMLCRYKVNEDGSRQIVGFNIAGDFCDLASLVLGRVDYAIGALTTAKVAVITRRELERIVQQRPAIQLALWQESLAEAATAREWVVNVGCRTGYQRIAHVLCEMGLRMQAAGIADDQSFDWPVSLVDLGEATGLSLIHVNRTLQQLSAEGLIRTENTTIHVPDWQALKEAGQFSPDYLFLGSATPQPDLGGLPAR